MIFLTAVVFGSLGAWLKNTWQDSDPHERKWIVGLAVCAVGAGVVGALRAVGVI